MPGGIHPRVPHAKNQPPRSNRQTDTQTEKAKKVGPIRQDERGRLSLSIY